MSPATLKHERKRIKEKILKKLEALHAQFREEYESGKVAYDAGKVHGVLSSILIVKRIRG